MKRKRANGTPEPERRDPSCEVSAFEQLRRRTATTSATSRAASRAAGGAAPDVAAPNKSARRATPRAAMVLARTAYVFHLTSGGPGRRPKAHATSTRVQCSDEQSGTISSRLICS